MDKKQQVDQPTSAPTSDNADVSLGVNQSKNPVSGSDEPIPHEQSNEIATNDGSVIETLDTVFHGKPGWSEGENPSGSSRADYYEARSTGRSDAEEEMDELKRKTKEG